MMELEMKKNTVYLSGNLVQMELDFENYNFKFDIEWVAEGHFKRGVVSNTHIQHTVTYPLINVTDNGKVTMDFDGIDSGRLRIVGRTLDKLTEGHMVMKQVNSELRQLARDGFKFKEGME